MPKQDGISVLYMVTKPDKTEFSDSELETIMDEISDAIIAVAEKYGIYANGGVRPVDANEEI